MNTEGKKGNVIPWVWKIIFPEVLSPDFMQFGNVAVQLVVCISSETFSAKTGIRVWHDLCKSLSVPFSTWAIKDQCEPYCTHCEVERVNGNVFIEIFPSALRREDVIFFPKYLGRATCLLLLNGCVEHKRKKPWESRRKSCGRPHKGGFYGLPPWKRTFPQPARQPLGWEIF